MAIKTTLNYSPNFDPKKRKTNQIKFLIYHYTGMKTEKAAIERFNRANQDQKNCVETLGNGVYSYKSLSWKLDNCNVPK